MECFNKFYTYAYIHISKGLMHPLLNLRTACDRCTELNLDTLIKKKLSAKVKNQSKRSINSSAKIK